MSSSQITIEGLIADVCLISLTFLRLPITLLFVSATLSDILFPASHVLKQLRSSVTFSLIVEMLLEEKDNLVSLAYILTCECLMNWGGIFCIDDEK